MGLFTGLLGLLLFLGSNASGLDFDSSVPDELKNQVLGDLGFIRSVRNERVSRLHREIYGGSASGNYSNWFDTRVSFFGFGDCGGSATAVACVMGRFDRKIWVTRNYVEIEHPQVARVMTLFHEARHTEGSRRNWPHSRCPIFYRRKSIWTGASLNWHFACDRTEYGSYGSASVLLNTISRFCSNCSGKVKMDADIYSSDQSKRIIKRSAYLRLIRDFKE